MKISEETRKRLMPFILTAAIIAADQVTKALIVQTIDKYTVGVSLFNGFLRIIHTRNLGIAFSLGGGAPEGARAVLFTVLPLAVLGVLTLFYFKDKTLTRLQQWAVAGVVGGGLGNLIDRIFRADGVVDFIDVKFFGIFGLDRWPTFNIADSSVVVCGIILAVSFIFAKKPADGEVKTDE